MGTLKSFRCFIYRTLLLVPTGWGSSKSELVGVTRRLLTVWKIRASRPILNARRPRSRQKKPSDLLRLSPCFHLCVKDKVLPALLLLHTTMIQQRMTTWQFQDIAPQSNRNSIPNAGVGKRGIFMILALCAVLIMHVPGKQVMFSSYVTKFYEANGASMGEMVENSQRKKSENQEERQETPPMHTSFGKSKRRQRIALMFGGAPRTLTQTGVMTSHVINVIDALGTDGLDIVDVFFHLNNGTSDGVYSSNNNPRAPLEPFTEKLLQNLRNLTSPVQIILHTDSSCSGLNRSISNHSCCTQNWAEIYQNWKSNFLQFAYLRQSYRYVKQYERENHVSYDWFVRIRPDVACFERMPAVRSLSARRYYLATKERQHSFNTNDYIFIVPRNLSHSFFEEQIMTAFEFNCPKGVSLYPAESTMFSLWPNLPYQALPLPCVHVTGPDSAECMRFTRHGQRWLPSIFDIERSKFGVDETFEQGCNRLVREGYFGNQSHVP